MATSDHKGCRSDAAIGSPDLQCSPFGALLQVMVHGKTGSDSGAVVSLSVGQCTDYIFETENYLTSRL